MILTSWSSFTQINPDLPPIPSMVVRPSRAIQDHMLVDPVYWLVGPAKIGKSTLALFYAYLRSLNWRDESDVLIVSGTSCVTALQNIVEFERHGVCVVANDPFGSREDGRSNQRFIDLVAAAASDLDTTVLVTSRVGPYELNGSPGSDGFVTPYSAAGWYDEAALINHLYEIGFDEAAAQRVRDHRVQTPAELHDFTSSRRLPLLGDERRRIAARFPSVRLSDAAADLLDAISSDEDLAAFAVGLRLQQYFSEPVTLDEFRALVGVESGDPLGAGLLLDHFTYDGARRVRPIHMSVAEAADAFMSSDTASARAAVDRVVQPSSPEATLDQLRREVARSYSSWSLEQHAIAGRAIDLTARQDDPALDVAGLVRASHGSAGVLGALATHPLDRWSALNLAFELAAIWPEIMDRADAWDVMRRLRDDREALGTYALVEACLYERNVPDVWRFATSELVMRATRDPSDLEVLLAIDALCWRPPPPDHETDWIGSIVDRLHPSSPGWGLIRFLYAYHPDGFASAVGPDTARRLALQDNGVRWTAEQADAVCDLVQWHFGHQSQARANMAARPWRSDDFLRRSFFGMNPVNGDTAHHLVSSLADHARHAGWAFFLALNMEAVGACGPEVRGAGLDALRRAEHDYQGVIAAVVTYPLPAEYLDEARAYFASDIRRDRLFAATRDGIHVSGIRFSLPRFAFRRSIVDIQDDLGITWQDVPVLAADIDIVTKADLVQFAAEMHDAALILCREDEQLIAEVAAVLGDIENFDLRELVALPNSWRGGLDTPHVGLLRSIIENRRHPRGLF